MCIVAANIAAFIVVRDMFRKSRAASADRHWQRASAACLETLAITRTRRGALQRGIA
ncbi:MAG: hypothetical protein KIT85_05325 [Pseudolabrys sp.]|nr:hypothetical protein [Pseudolabrys sp.]